jgi:hypothetical protein
MPRLTRCAPLFRLAASRLDGLDAIRKGLFQNTPANGPELNENSYTDRGSKGRLGH